MTDIFRLQDAYRDEDLRADRQPEFTQVDMELSFVDVDDVIDVNERLLQALFKEILDVDVQLTNPENDMAGSYGQIWFR